MFAMARGSFIEGIFGRQPDVEDVRKQVVSMQDSPDQLEETFQQQAEVIDMMVMQYCDLKFYQFVQRNILREQIQDELVCQYAALDYLMILVSTAESGEKLSREDFDFYRTYCKVLADNLIDDVDELVTLRPIMHQRHRSQIEALQRYSLDCTLARIRKYK